MSNNTSRGKNHINIHLVRCSVVDRDWRQTRRISKLRGYETTFGKFVKPVYFFFITYFYFSYLLYSISLFYNTLYCKFFSRKYWNKIFENYPISQDMYFYYKNVNLNLIDWWLIILDNFDKLLKIRIFHSILIIEQFLKIINLKDLFFIS